MMDKEKQESGKPKERLSLKLLCNLVNPNENLINGSFIEMK